MSKRAKEIYEKSTKEERLAEVQYKDLQDKAKSQGYITEGQLLLLSQVVGILVARNKRLGLC